MQAVLLQAACSKRSVLSEELQPARKFLPNECGPSGVPGRQSCKSGGMEKLGVQQRPAVLAIPPAFQQPPPLCEARVPKQQLMKQAKWEGRAVPSEASLSEQQPVVSSKTHTPAGEAEEDCETFYSPELVPIGILQATPGEALHRTGSHAVETASQPLRRAFTEELLVGEQMLDHKFYNRRALC